MSDSRFPSQRKNEVHSYKKIVSANLFSRTVAAIVDIACVAFVAGILLSLLQVLFAQFPNVKEIQTTYKNYYLESSLFTENDKGDLELLEFDNYVEYQNAIHEYYTDYKVNKCPEQYRSDIYDNYWYNVHILGLEDSLGKYTVEQLNNRSLFIVQDGPTLFEYQTEGETVLYNELAKPKAEATEEALLAYYYIPEEKNTEQKSYVYLVAANDLFATPYFSACLEEVQLWINYIPLLISAILSSIVFLFIIPLCTKYGRTLGKLMFHLAVVNKLGYDIKKYQIVPRFWFPVLVMVFAFFVCQLIGGQVLMSYLLFVTLYTLTNYGMVLFTKGHKAIHDYFALTQVINMKESVWYKDAQEEERVTKSITQSADAAQDLEQEIEGKHILYVNKDPKTDDTDPKTTD